MGYLAVTLAAVLVGLVVGFVIGKRATQWCPICGLTLSISHCPAHGWLPAGSKAPGAKTVR